MTLHKRAACAAVGLLAGFASVFAPALAETPISKDAAIARVLDASPSLEAARARMAEMDAAITQMGAKLNPTIGAEVENFTGSGPFTGLDRTEMTVTYAQQIERGNKRSLRTSLAREEAGISEAEWHVRRLDLVHMVEKAYVEAVAAKARVNTLEAQLVILRDIEAAIRKRVEVGKDSDLAAQNASIRTLNAVNRLQEAKRELEAAKLALAGLWGGSAIDFLLETEGMLSLPDAVTPVTAEAVLDGPDMAVWYKKEEARSAALRLEKANAVQDPTVRVGLRYHQMTSDVAAVASVSIPLALHDTNKGNISRARAAVTRSRFERLEVERQLSRQLMMAHTQQMTAFQTARQLEANLKAAEAAEMLVMDRMAKGAASYLDVFAAQSLLADIQAQQLDAVTRFHLAQADINRLTATYSTDVVTPAAALARDEGDQTDREGY
ncbi:TolC family protein [Kordiimonas lipolytica]|uniref:TolC family protein n=1 Tax=Kordiimonas lipolytica TaxID=1662421 RepID=A0ABV8UAB7_9PROT|nr:TolC family protein [Kordiimonas lipolytica]